MSDVDKILRKVLLKTSDVIHDPGAAIDQITRLTERVAELEGVLRHYLDNAAKRSVCLFDFDTGEYPINGDTINLLVTEKHELKQRADKLQARLDAALKLIEKWRNDGSLNKGFCADDLAYALRDKDADPDS